MQYLAIHHETLMKKKLIKSISLENSCDKQYLEQFNKGKMILIGNCTPKQTN